MSKAKQGLKKSKPQIEEMMLRENLSTWPFKMKYKSQGVGKPLADTTPEPLQCRWESRGEKESGLVVAGVLIVGKEDR